MLKVFLIRNIFLTNYWISNLTWQATLKWTIVDKLCNSFQISKSGFYVLQGKLLYVCLKCTLKFLSVVVVKSQSCWNADRTTVRIAVSEGVISKMTAKWRRLSGHKNRVINWLWSWELPLSRYIHHGKRWVEHPRW